MKCWWLTISLFFFQCSERYAQTSAENGRSHIRKNLPPKARYVFLFCPLLVIELKMWTVCTCMVCIASYYTSPAKQLSAWLSHCLLCATLASSFDVHHGHSKSVPPRKLSAGDQGLCSKIFEMRRRRFLYIRFATWIEASKVLASRCSPANIRCPRI